jgi:hypothetical protein
MLTTLTAGAAAAVPAATSVSEQRYKCRKNLPAFGLLVSAAGYLKNG